MSLLLAAPTTQSLLLPLSSLRCKAGCCGHPPSCLLLKAPSPPCPLLPGLPVELFFSLCISQRSKADASILSGDGDVRRMARGLQAGVGRFPAISQALVPFPSSHWLVPEAWTEAWGRDGEKKRMGRDMLTPQAHPAGMQACSQLSARCSLPPMKGAGIQPCPAKVCTRDQSGPGSASWGRRNNPTSKHEGWGEKEGWGWGSLFLPESPPVLGALGERHACLAHRNVLGMIRDRVSRTPP